MLSEPYDGLTSHPDGGVGNTSTETVGVCSLVAILTTCQKIIVMMIAKLQIIIITVCEGLHDKNVVYLTGREGILSKNKRTQQQQQQQQQARLAPQNPIHFYDNLVI